MSGHRGTSGILYKTGLVAVSVAVLILSPGLGSVSADLEELFSGVTTLIAPYSQNPVNEVDARISPGEYDANVTYTASDTGVTIYLLHDNESLFVGISGPTWSWVALGISSDDGVSMGFIVIARGGGGYIAEERLVTSISEDMTFSPPSPGHHAIDEFDSSISGGNSVAELELSLDSSMWTLAPGIVYPTVVATNLTAPAGFPIGLSGDQVHFVGSYLLRSIDDVKKMDDLLNGKTSPIPSLVAAGILSLGVLLIFVEFAVRRRKT